MSFVIQNYQNIFPFLIKTYRHYTFIKYYSLPLVSILSRLIFTFKVFSQISFFINSFFKFLLNKQFYSYFWLNLRKVTYKASGLVTNNLTKSYQYNYFSFLNFLISKPNQIVPLKISSCKTFYKPITVINFPFQKKLHNTSIIYLFYFFSDLYFTAFNDFSLKFSFVFLAKNFIFYFFLNHYYFKLRSY